MYVAVSKCSKVLIVYNPTTLLVTPLVGTRKVWCLIYYLRNSDTWWRLITATLLSILFGSCRRCRRDVPLRPLDDVTLGCCWVFHLRLV